MSKALNKDSSVESVCGMAPTEAAAWWLVRLDGDTASEGDRAAFEAWRASPANAAAYDKARSAWDIFDDIEDDQHARALRQSALAAGPERHALRWMGVAASIVALVGVAVVGAVQFGRDAATITARVADLHALGAPDYVTEKGERLNLTLPDGTAVTLNTSTEIDVAYSGGTRFIKMTDGQAFFEVAKDPDRPFVVEAGDQQITALGTAFDVRFLNNKVEVILAEGTIAVEQSLAEAAVLDAPPEPVIMTAGQELVAAAGAAPRVEPVDVVRKLRWRDGYIEFQDESLAEAVAEFNRYTARPIVIRDDRVAALRVAGRYRTDRPDNFIEAMSELLPVAIDRREPSEVEFIWSDG